MSSEPPGYRKDTLSAPAALVAVWLTVGLGVCLAYPAGPFIVALVMVPTLVPLALAIRAWRQQGGGTREEESPPN
jgi:hypothetical protein